MQKTDWEKKIERKRLEGFVIAQKEVKAGRKCTIMGRTFTRNDLRYIREQIKHLKVGGIS